MKKENDFFGVVYDVEKKIKNGSIIEVFYEEKDDTGYSHYVYVTEVIFKQTHNNALANFLVVSVKGIDVTELYLSNFTINQIRDVVNWL